MDIKIEVVGKGEELEFPYVAKFKSGQKVLIINQNLNNVENEVWYRGFILNAGEMSGYDNFEYYDDWRASEITKRYKILEANYKLKEV